MALADLPAWQIANLNSKIPSFCLAAIISSKSIAGPPCCEKTP